MNESMHVRAAPHAASAGNLVALEHECADLRWRNDLAHAILEANRDIAATREPEAAIRAMLRAMRTPLAFARAIYFTIDRERGVEPFLQIDGSETAERSFERLDTSAGSAALAVLRGEPDGIGRAGELCAPLVDVRGWYVLCALASTDGTLGLLYADGHAARRPVRSHADLVRIVASVAAVAIENGTRFERMSELASRDPLTGLLNRRALAERLEMSLQRARDRARSCAYVLIDIDDFKLVNDRHGHSYGDDVLTKLSAVLMRHSRAGDIVGRYAGDEFTIVMPDVDANVARSLVARLSAELRDRGLRCSLGVALYPADASDARGLFEAADHALYMTKASGKNGFAFF